MEYIILKLSDKDKNIIFSDVKDLITRANGEWRINPQRIGKIDTALLLFRGQIIGEFSIGEILKYNRITKRTTFDMKPVSNSKYIGKILNYKTSNPATVMDDKKLKDSLIN